MKLSLIAVSLCLIGCAHGVEPDSTSEPEVVTISKNPTLRPAPIQEPEESDASAPIRCTVNAYWVGACYVVKIYCEGKPVQTEVACRGPELWPWERDPYPPPYDRTMKDESNAGF